MEGADYGVRRIMRLCDDHGGRATFFVSVFECGRYGEPRVARLCQEIATRGHDVQLHTHPRWCFDKHRRDMWRYSLDEQLEIIDCGKQLLVDWLGAAPVAHRAGAYGADNNTLCALAARGFRIDSSAFFEHANCRLDRFRNLPDQRDGVWELPITVYRRRRMRWLGFAHVPVRSEIVKTDLNSARDTELEWFLDWAVAQEIPVVHCFMHSYSLIRFDQRCQRFVPAHRVLRRFQRFLSTVASRPGIRMTTMAEVAADPVGALQYGSRINTIPTYRAYPHGNAAEPPFGGRHVG